MGDKTSRRRGEKALSPAFSCGLGGAEAGMAGRDASLAIPADGGCAQRPVTIQITPDWWPVPQRVVASEGPMNSSLWISEVGI